MEHNLNRFVDTYTKSINENNAAIFAGAGLSLSAGFVNWKNLLREIASELNLDIDKENDLLSVAQFHYNEKGNNRHRLNQLLIDEFTQGVSVTKNHSILASLPIQTYWTTNYDKLIEIALENAGKTPDVKITQNNLATNTPKRDAIVYKMHGDISLPDEAILTKDDYEGYNEKRSLFTTALQGDLVEKTFLFIGFSFDDPNLEYILSRIRILLGQNQRDHYCFFKKVNRKDYTIEAEYNYAEIKQQLKIKDLRRYSINALLISEYSEISDVLTAIQNKLLRRNVFISGAAYTYSPRTDVDALSFLHKLSYSIISSGFKIVSGIGVGIGSAIINGGLEYIFSTKYRHVDNYLILRPFPQVSTGLKSKEELNLEYREEILSNSGLALFIFGNKENETGKIINSDGMNEEFELAIKKGIIPVPVGASGYMAEILWDKVMSSPNKYYPNNKELLDSIKQLGNKTLNDDQLIGHIVKTIITLQNLI